MPAKQSLFANLLIVCLVALIGCGTSDTPQAPVEEEGGPPATPTNVQVDEGDGSFGVAWNPVQGAEGYRFYMASAQGVTVAGYQQLPGGTMHEVSGNTYHLSGLNNDTTYYFVLTAYNADGESGATTEYSATPSLTGTPPDAPLGLTAAAGDATMTLDWQAVAAAESYRLYMAEEPGVGPSNYGSLAGGVAFDAASTTYTRRSLVNDRTYYATVTAVNEHGESSASLEVSDTPTAAVLPPAIVIVNDETGGPIPGMSKHASVVDGDDVYLVWTAGGEIYFDASADGGWTWGADQRVDTTEEHKFSPYLAETGGVLVATYQGDEVWDGGAYSSNSYIAKAPAASPSFTETGLFVNDDIFSFDGDPLLGSLHLLQRDSYVHSLNGGDSWISSGDIDLYCSDMRVYSGLMFVTSFAEYSHDIELSAVPVQGQLTTITTPLVSHSVQPHLALAADANSVYLAWVTDAYPGDRVGFAVHDHSLSQVGEAVWVYEVTSGLYFAVGETSISVDGNEVAIAWVERGSTTNNLRYAVGTTAGLFGEPVEIVSGTEDAIGGPHVVRSGSETLLFWTQNGAIKATRQ